MDEKTVALRGIEMAYAEWGTTASGPTVLLLHATGFHGRCWDAVARALEGEAHVLAPDMRGHGRTTKRGPYDWRQAGEDVAAFVQELELNGVVGAGHSKGGHALVQAAAAQPHRFDKLLLVDPVILDPRAYDGTGRMPTFASAEDHPVARRRNRWASPEEMFERFANRHPFSLWQPDILMDYCRYGLTPDGDGYVLACPPLVEASIYQGSAGRDIMHLVSALPHPVTVLRAHRRAPDAAPRQSMDFSESPTWDGLAAAFPNGTDVYLPELTHFIPMQRPDLVAAHLRELTE